MDIKIPEGLKGKDLQKWGDHAIIPVLRKEQSIINTTQEDSVRIRESVHKAKLLKKLKDGKLKLVRSIIKKEV